jgi:PAS domain S-box-containing protein
LSHDSAISGHYDVVLVVLSIFIAILSAFAALDLAGRITWSRTRSARQAWLGGGAVAMGIGVWAMHYIGMLAFKMNMPVLYDWPLVLLSLVAAIFASAVALFVVSRKTMGPMSTIAGSVVMGGGIASMHYIGMAAMRMPAKTVYSLPMVAGSIAAAVIIAFAALQLTFTSRHILKAWTWRKILSGLLMGFAIPVMHYLGMAAASFAPMSGDMGAMAMPSLTHSVNISDLGAASIALVTVVMLCLVFVSAMIDRRFTHQAQELEGSEQRYRKIISSTFDAFLGIDAEGKIMDWNAQAKATFGWSAEEAIGRRAQEILLLDTAQNGGMTMTDLLTSGAEMILQGRLEVTATHKSGLQFPAEMAISAIGIGNSTIYAAFVHDVTDRKLAQRHMEEARQAAEAASQAKSEFLANMSHEIRTPLNGVIGMTDLVLETELTREQREYLETVKLSADALLSVINDILDFSKIEAGKVELEEIRYDLRECLESTLKMLALRADEKGLELLCDISPGAPEAVLGDAGRLRQIITNLIGNAIKFTSEGEVGLQVYEERADNNESMLHFTISDTGIGIAPHKLETIFESFSQADTSTTRVYGGTGLGLTISKRLIELMSGRIWIESELGKGSHFHLVVPMKKTEPIAKTTEYNAAYEILHGTKVLIIDDNKTNRRILEGLVLGWGMLPVTAADGQSALDHLVEANERGEHYHLILTDMHMPKMDGFSVVQQIQQNPSLSASTIMMLSSGGHRGDAAKCQELGIAAYLLKPVRQNELREAIARALSGQAVHRHSTMITQNTLRDTALHQPLSILLAEDNLVNQKLAIRLLEKRGHSVKVVDNGREAVMATENRVFDLVLMDISMPEMDGITATTTIREREQKTGIYQPIVAMTALVMQGDRERCLEAKMDGYISKPIRPVELDEVLEQYSTRKHAALTASGVIKEKEAIAAPVEADAPAAINVTELMERIDGDVEFVAELSDIFREDYPRHLAAAHAFLDAGDAEGLKRTAHALKGALANLAATHAASVAAQLERLGGIGDLATGAVTLSELETELPRVLSCLDVLCKEPVL